MEERRRYFKKINDSLAEMNSTINYLYKATNTYAKNRLLSKLHNNISDLLVLTQSMEISENAGENADGAGRFFTLQELMRYNGRDGSPPYVAINGVVYDVSDARSWVRGMHHGMMAGRDITKAFESCHIDESVLSKLKIVGKIRND